MRITILIILSGLVFSACEMTRNFARKHYRDVKEIHDYCSKNKINDYERGGNSDKFLEHKLKQLRAEALTFSSSSTSRVERCEPRDSVLILIDHGQWPFGHYSKLMYNYSTNDTLYNDCNFPPDYNFYRLNSRMYLVRKNYGVW